MLYYLIVLFGVIPLCCLCGYLTYKFMQFLWGFSNLFFFRVMDKGLWYALVWLAPWWSIPDAIEHLILSGGKHGCTESGGGWVFKWPSTFRKKQGESEND